MDRQLMDLFVQYHTDWDILAKHVVVGDLEESQRVVHVNREFGVRASLSGELSQCEKGIFVQY